MKLPCLPSGRLAAGLLLLAAQLAIAQSGTVDPTFNVNLGSYSYAHLDVPALQPDGKIVLDYPTGSIAVRVNPDGGRDPAFANASPGVGATVFHCSAILPDGKILIGGGDSYPIQTSFLRRFNPDGTPDPAFNAKLTAPAGDLDHSVRCLAILNDGRILIGGVFLTLAGQTRAGLARLQPDGTLDIAFNPQVNGFVRSIAVQPDGKAIIVGQFTNIGGTQRNNIARINADGTLDSTFNPNVSSLIYTVALQADGEILIGGTFGTVGGLTQPTLARLSANGVLDGKFKPNNLGITPCWSLAVQTNGQILAVGSGNQFDPSSNQLIRLNGDGSKVAPSPFAIFSANARSLALQRDGKILVGGDFNTVNSSLHELIARLNNDLATEALSVPDSGQVRWLRGGTNPEAQAVSFELSTDGGASWTTLGFASRITGGWQLTGLQLPAAGAIRARARTATGYCNASSSLIETVHAYVLPAPPTVTTRSPYSVDFSSVKLDGTVNPNGAAGTWHFEYGADPALAGSSSTPLVPFAAGTADLQVGTGIAGLAPTSVYYCRAVATTANGTTPGEIVAFTTAGTPGDLWRYQHFGAAWQGVSFAADDDGDGLSNLAEYAFGGDPLAPDSAAILPKIDTANGRLRITFTRDPAHTDIADLDVEASNDLVTWTTIAHSRSGAATAPYTSGVVVSETALGARKTVQVTDNTPVATVPQRALRVKVSR